MSTGLTLDDIARTHLLVGLEIHIELTTRSKMFTRAANPACAEFEDAEPNTLVDPLVAALPGTLPVMNRAAVEMSAMVGMALGCSIAEHAKWDRKNYVYPDLPKGYQISQYDLPLCFDGAVDIPSDDPDLGGVRSGSESPEPTSRRTPESSAMNCPEVGATRGASST